MLTFLPYTLHRLLLVRIGNQFTAAGKVFWDTLFHLYLSLHFKCLPNRLLHFLAHCNSRLVIAINRHNYLALFHWFSVEPIAMALPFVLYQSCNWSLFTFPLSILGLFNVVLKPITASQQNPCLITLTNQTLPHSKNPCSHTWNDTVIKINN